MKKLIIAEKPSLAKNIATALGVTKRADGYLENEQYVITWAFGHLLELKTIDDYEGKKQKWHEISVPYIPSKFELKVKTDNKTKKTDVGSKNQIEIIKNLILRSDITEIVNAGDSDREGQIIIDNIILFNNCKKPIKRLWLPEQTAQTIVNQMNNLNDNKSYNNLAQEGYARTYLDWLFGINLTIFASVKSGVTSHVGRVSVPIIRHIYDRDLAIRNFIKKEYHIVESVTKVDNVAIKLSVKEKTFALDEFETAKKFATELNQKNSIVTSIERKKIVKNPKKLFSLSKLQAELSKKHKISFETSLKTIQELYEKGYITYPRTNTEYLAENEKEKVKSILDILKKDYPVEFKDTKKIFDTSKIESHSALTPTVKIPANLTGLENTIYTAILNRFISNFLSEETVTDKTTITIETRLSDTEKYEQKLNGEVLISEGFYKYEPEKFENQLPNLTEGQELKNNFVPVVKETQPPKKITEESLSNFLKNPFKKLKEDEELEADDTASDEEDYKAILEGLEIGTEATRTGIIAKTKNQGYIAQDKSNFSITQQGEQLIQIIDKLELKINKETSVEFSKLQKEVYKGTKTLDEVIQLAKKNLIEITTSGIEIEKIKNTNFEKEIYGICPKCGKNVTENKNSFSCEGWKDTPKCDFSIWKTNLVTKTTIKKAEVKKLLSKKSIIIDKISYSLDDHGKLKKQK